MLLVLYGLDGDLNFPLVWKKKKRLNLGCHRQNAPDDKGDDFREAIAIGGTFISKNASGERKGSQVLQRQGGKDVIDKSYGGA